MTRFFSAGAITALLLCSPQNLSAAVKPASVFSDHMVLQQDIAVPIWGTAPPGEAVSVSFQNQKIEGKADAKGNWKVTLAPLKLSREPAELTITGGNSIVFRDVLVGEVWLCSGQSNMEWTVSHNGISVKDAKTEIANANYPLIRHLKIPKANAKSPQNSFKAEWVVCSPTTAGSFSGVGYFFARELFNKLDVPIGLINASYGGTPAEAWMRAEVIRDSPACEPLRARFAKTRENWPQIMAQYRKDIESWNHEAKAAKEAGQKVTRPKPRQPVGEGHPYSPATVYNAMLHPVVSYAIRGCIWYQGEGNTGHAEEYHGIFSTLIEAWRREWGQDNFPFYFVQLANYKTNAPDVPNWAWLRDAQTKTLAVPNTGMAVTIDVGDPNELHPRDKQSVGYRLALIALNKTYGNKEIEFSGPAYSAHQVNGDTIQITFAHAAGLKSRTGELAGFEIAGVDQKFYPAKAIIRGETMTAAAPEVKRPVAVRYAWSNAPEASLYNAANLPASPFRTDQWKRTDPH